MKKLLLVVAALATSSLALAAPSFTLPAEIDLTAGVPTTVYVGVIDVAQIAGGGAQGMNLYLGTQSPLVLSNGVVLDAADPSLLFTGTNSNPPSILGNLDDQTWNASITTSGTNRIALNGNVARITITAPLGSEGLVGTLSTSLADWGVDSDFAGPTAGQATAIVKVIPEPSSLLLLIAGLPLLRRRHA